MVSMYGVVSDLLALPMWLLPFPTNSFLHLALHPALREPERACSLAVSLMGWWHRLTSQIGLLYRSGEKRRTRFSNPRFTTLNVSPVFRALFIYLFSDLLSMSVIVEQMMIKHEISYFICPDCEISFLSNIEFFVCLFFVF